MNNICLEPKDQAEACIIWMHGLGADASDMKGLAMALPATLPIKHVCLNAPVRSVTINQGMSMRAWYDILGFDLVSREDKAGIVASQEHILHEIQAQIDQGFHHKAIYLAGFSQGGAMALWTAMQSQTPIGGVIALSSYLPLAQTCRFAMERSTPMFIGYGSFDTIVKPQWTEQTIQLIQQQGFENMCIHSYPMDHAICMDEIHDLAHWLQITLKPIKQDVGEN